MRAVPPVVLAIVAGAMAAPAIASPAAIADEWGRYDVADRGVLTPLEFGRWIMAANGTRLDGREATDAQLLDATSVAFALADADRDGFVSRVEMVRFTQL